MKKTILSIVAIGLLATRLLAIDTQTTENKSVNNMQQKTEFILIKKVTMLEKRVEELKTAQIKTNMELSKIKEKLLISNDVLSLGSVTNSASNSKGVATGIGSGAAKLKSININAKNTMKEKSLSKNISDRDIDKKLKNIYILKEDTRGYRKSTGFKKAKNLFKKDSFVLISSRGKKRYLTQSGSWVDKNLLGQINRDILKQGNFYRVSTYMANSRSDAGVENEIESVFYKNDLLFITGSKKTLENGIWKNIKNDGYINARIIKPISYK